MSTDVVVSRIAQVAHETNRAYCASIGDYSQEKWEVAPLWQRQSAIKGVLFVMAALESRQEPRPSASHESWMEEKRRDGWRYGPVKRPDLKEHPCFVPYEDLPAQQKVKDHLFIGVVRAFWESGVRIEESELQSVSE